jgi:hypothetical protein
MGRSVIGAAVGLDLDDPTRAARRAVLADETGAEQAACGLGRAARKEGPIEDAQAGLPG